MNAILEVLKLDSFADPGKTWGELDLAATLDALLDGAYARGVLAEDSIVYRDLFDTEVMGLAVLPARLKEELTAVAGALISGADMRANELTAKHAGVYRRSPGGKAAFLAFLREV